MKTDRKEYFRQWHIKHRQRRLLEARANYRKNKERRLAQSKAWDKAHPEAVRKRYLKYQVANREICRERNRDWRKVNLDSQRKREKESKRLQYKLYREHILAINRKWAHANKDKIRIRDLKRKALKKGAALGDQSVIFEWMRQIRKLKFVRCHWCGTKVSGRQVHFDHVIALNIGGAHSIANLCCSCPECNTSKQDKALSEWVARGQTFLSI